MPKIKVMWLWSDITIFIYIYVKSCRLTNHFLDKDHDLVRDKNQKEFDNSLVKHIRIKIIDNVEWDPNLCT